MSAPIRFIGLALFAWVGVRAASLGLLPGMTALVPPAAAQPVAPATSAMVSTPAMAQQYSEAVPAAYAPPPHGYAPSPYYYPMPGYRGSQTIVVPAGWSPPQVRYAETRPSAWDAVLPTPATPERFAEFELSAFEAAAPFAP